MHANNKGAGQYSYPGSLTSAFIVRLLESIISKLASCKISFYLVSVAEQTGLSLTQSETRKTVYHEMAMYLTTYLKQKILFWNVSIDRVDLEYKRSLPDHSLFAYA